MDIPASQIDTLRRINTQDFLNSFGLNRLRRGRKPLEALCWLPARGFARRMAAFDQQVGRDGLQAASRRALSGYTRGLEVHGVENIPAGGPLLVLSNHPGMSDTLALFASLPRGDLRVIAAERPFLHALGHVSQRLIYVPEDAGQRMRVVRCAASHLRAGGAALTFPAGEIEPDPASMPGALAALDGWSESVGLFTRLAPGVRVVVALVSGVVWPSALKHPLTRLRRASKDREGLAAALQILAQTLLPGLRPVTPRVDYSPALEAGGLNPAALIHAVRGQAQVLIENLSTERRT